MGRISNSTRRARLLQAAALCAVAALVLAALPVQAATSVAIEARPLVGGRYAAGGWLAIGVALSNDGAPTTGYVAADSPDGTARRYVDLPAGARKSVTIYVRPQAFARTVKVRFEASEGVASTEVEVRVLERSSSQVAIVGDGAGNLRAQILGPEQSGLPEPITLGPADIPERPEPLAGIAAIVWAGDSSPLTEAQRRSLERWVAAGGQLVVVGGPDWQARTAAFLELLPVEVLAAVDGAALDGLAAWAGATELPSDGTTAATGALRAGDMALVAAGDGGPPLLAMGNRGAGRVIYVAVDLATPGYRAWTAAPALWSRVLPSDVVAEKIFGPGFPIEEEAANIMSQALSNLPSLDVPPAELLLIVIVGYILLIGPASYLVLRRLDRRELAWLSAPVLVVIFTACSYGVGTSMKGSQIIVNQISLVRVASAGTAASVQSYAGIFSPTRSTYDLTVEADALIAPLRATAFEPVPQQQVPYVTEQGDPAHLRDLSVGVFGFQAVRADAVVEHRPALQVSWSLGDGSITGTVTNTGEEPMDDVAVISASGGRMVGDLEAGASKDFTLSLSNFNGTPASDQVYGFAGFDPSNPAQREANVRREVINSLVGYGGWFPGRGVGFGIGVDRGPFVIGWRAGEGPLPVEVDGQQVQRYSHTVEVVSGRPALGPGEVRLDPSQLAVRVLSTDGDASAAEPGWVTLGNGEVTFGITLPLEAARLAPSLVRIVVGSDPSMVFADQGGFGFGGFLPAGFTLSVRDPRSGEWVLLGNLNEKSSFEINDPASVLSSSGRIEVRVVGAGVDPSFGQASVFVGAGVEGVVAP